MTYERKRETKQLVSVQKEAGMLRNTHVSLTGKFGNGNKVSKAVFLFLPLFPIITSMRLGTELPNLNFHEILPILPIQIFHEIFYTLIPGHLLLSSLSF